MSHYGSQGTSQSESSGVSHHYESQAMSYKYKSYGTCKRKEIVQCPSCDINWLPETRKGVTIILNSWPQRLATPKNTQGSLQKVVLYIFRPPEHESELYFSKNFLVQVLGFLLTLPVPHCSKSVFCMITAKPIILPVNTHEGGLSKFNLITKQQWVCTVHASAVCAVLSVHVVR